MRICLLSKCHVASGMASLITQCSWDAPTTNKLRGFIQQLGEWPISCRLSGERRPLFLLISQTYLTNKHLLKSELQPECTCIGFQCPLTVIHISWECIAFDGSRRNHFNVDALWSYFKEVSKQYLQLFKRNRPLWQNVTVI